MTELLVIAADLVGYPLRTDERRAAVDEVLDRVEHQKGLFAAGDVRADSAGQAISAAGDGATAAVAAHRYLVARAR